MILENFLNALGLRKPLVAIQGDIFNTPGDHIAFAVHWPDSNGKHNNAGSGFAAKVAKLGWPELRTIKFEKGVPVTKKIKGKYFHAMPVHCNEKNGWEEAPFWIQTCLNKIPVDSTEVISVVLIGGGEAGLKYGASVRNIEGMLKSYKTVVLHVNDPIIFKVLVNSAIVAQPITNTSLMQLPKVIKYRDSDIRSLKVLHF